MKENNPMAIYKFILGRSIGCITDMKKNMKNRMWEFIRAMVNGEWCNPGCPSLELCSIHLEMVNDELKARVENLGSFLY